MKLLKVVNLGKRKREADPDCAPVAVKKPRKEVEEDSDSSFSIPEELYNDAADATSPQNAGGHQEKREKKKTKKNVSFQDLSDSDSDVVEQDKSKFFNGVEEKRKEKSKKRDSNGSSAVPKVEEESDCVVYLIRKPIDVSIDDLQNLSLPAELGKEQKLKLKTEQGRFALKTSSIDKKLFYFPQKTVVTAKDAQKIRSASVIHAQATVTRVTKDVPGGPIIAPGEEVPEGLEMPFVIKSVRKKPVLDLSEKKERLTAFGVKTKKRKSRKSTTD